MSPTRIYIIDDHKIVRDGLKAMLLAVPQYQVVGEAATGKEALERIGGLAVEVAFVDLRLTDANGALLIKELLLAAPGLRCILLTAEPNALDLARARQAGALGFLSKEIDTEEYLRAIAAVLVGKKYVSQAFAHLLVEETHALSLRELEVLQLLSDGLPYKQIADKLSISARTVESHKNNLLGKLEVSTPIEMVKKALRLGLIKS